MGWEISKSFDFCYGHRVHNQTLNAEYSLDSCTACRHLHGHQGKVIVTLTSEELRNGMVTDFKHLNWFKKWLNETLDHKFIMDVSDPLLSAVFPGITPDMIHDTYWDDYFLPYTIMKNNPSLSPPKRELYEGLVLVDFVPTSENLSRLLFNIITRKMSEIEGDIIVKKVEFYETPKSKSVYAG